MQSNRPRIRRDPGFTLVELLVAAMLLAIVAVGVAAAMVQTPRLTRSAREDVAIRTAMRSVVAEISAAPFSEVPATYDDYAFEVPGIEATRADPDGIPGLVKIRVEGEAAATFYIVTISVTWQGVHGARTLRNAHYLANVRGDTEVTGGAGSADGSDSTDPNTANDGSGTPEEETEPIQEPTEGG